MKKSEFISLVLISSALASCGSMRVPLTPKNMVAGPDTGPERPYRAAPADNYYYYSDNYRRDSMNIYRAAVTGFALPTNFVAGPYRHRAPAIEYGGFGHFGSHMSFSS